MTTSDTLESAAQLAKTSPLKAVESYKRILASFKATTGVEDHVKTMETCIYALASLYKQQNLPKDLADLVRSSQEWLLNFPKAKTAKLLKTLIDEFSEIPSSLSLQIQVTKEAIEWALKEKRIFLRQSLETRLAGLYLEHKMYSDALKLIDTLLRELKRLDDKATLMEVQLLESRVYHSLRNMPKARAALTSARTSANAIYCPPIMQGALDLQSGILHADEKDYKTAFSYFFETLESFSSIDDKRAVSALKYMLLCKIMSNLKNSRKNNKTDDVHAIIHGKLASKYPGIEIEAMKAVAAAHQNRSLVDFEKALSSYKKDLTDDPIIRTHLTALYDTLLEQNLLRIIEPYSRVEISHIASQVKLPTAQVETKLSQMILDKVFYGIIDQGAGCLEVYDEPQVDKTYEAALGTIKNMGHAVESLYIKAGQLS